MADSSLTRLIDGRPLSRFQIVTIILCGLTFLVDGFDTQVVSYAAPLMAKQWQLSHQMLGHLFSAGLGGGMIGYLLLAPFSDRVGHKRAIVLSTLTFGLLTLATIFVKSFDQLLALRFCTGVALGVTAPSLVALVGEYSPRRFRATIILIVYCGFSLGFVSAGAVSAVVLADYGWPGLFWIGAVAPLILVPVLALFLPESFEYLWRQGSEEKMQKVLKRIEPTAQIDLTPFHSNKTHNVPVVALFGEGRAKGTLLLWLLFFFNAGSFYVLQSWLPTLLTNAQRSLDVVTAATAISTVGGISAVFIIGPLMDRGDRLRTLATLYTVGVVGVALLGFAFSAPFLLLLVVSFWAGACVSGGQKGAIAVASLYYPLSLRGAGVGWALGIGRLGSVLGPITAGALLASGLPPPVLCLCLSGALIVCTAIALLLSRTNASSGSKETADAHVVASPTFPSPR